MSKRYLLGQLTPSSNTILEPMCARILHDVPDVTAHFSRFVVKRIALGCEFLAQFDNEPILAAARLLADAKMNAISWNGTSSGWLGFEADVKLCEEITKATGIPAGTSVLALNEVFEKTGVRRFGLVSPYTDDVQSAIIANYKKSGWECVGENHFGDPGNFSFSEYNDAQIAEAVRKVAKSKPEAITIFCTNLRGAALVDGLEKETGIPIYDTVSLSIWKSMVIAGADPRRVKGWGRLFSEVR